MDIAASPKAIGLLLAGLYLIYSICLRSYTAYRRHLFKQANGCQPLPAYPHKDRILGTDYVFDNLKALKEGDYLPKVQQRYDRLGVNTWQSQMLGRWYIQTCDPENVKAILATQFKDFALPRSRNTMAKVFGFGIFINNGQAWEHSRAMLRPNFNRAQVADLEALEFHFKKMISRISTDGSTTDVQPLFFMLTMDSATEFLFGHSSGTLDVGASHEHGIKFSQAFTDATHHIGKLARTPKQVRWMLDNKQYNKDTAFIHEYVSEYVNKAVNMYKNGTKRSEKYIFLEELAMTGQGAPKIQAELLNILLAGRDTTAGLLSYLFYTLPRHQKVMDKLRAEVAELEGRAPNYDEVKRMKYLSWVINEALRLFPVVPLNAREAVRDTTLPQGGGPDGKAPIFVKKGQVVNYHPYVMHRRKDLYGEAADDFNPERWADLRPGWAYIPFNGGPRICLGQQYALMEASYITVRLLQTYKSIESKGDMKPARVQLTVTASISGGVDLVCTPAI